MGFFGIGSKDKIEELEEVDRVTISATGAAIGFVSKLLKDVQDPKMVPETDTQLPAELFIYNRVKLALNQTRTARKKSVNLNDLYPDNIQKFNFPGRDVLINSIGSSYKQLVPLIKEQQDVIDTGVAALESVSGPVQKAYLLKRLNIAKAALNIAIQQEEKILDIEKKIEGIHETFRKMIKQAA